MGIPGVPNSVAGRACPFPGTPATTKDNKGVEKPSCAVSLWERPAHPWECGVSLVSPSAEPVKDVSVPHDGSLDVALLIPEELPALGTWSRTCPSCQQTPLRVRGLNTSTTALIILESHLSQNSQRTSPRAPCAGGCRDEGTGNKYQSDFIGGRGTAAPSPGPGLLVLQTPFSSFPSSSSSRRSRHTWHLEPGAVQWYCRGILIPEGSLSLRAACGIGGDCGLTERVKGHSRCQGRSRGTGSSGLRGLTSTPNPWRGAEGECGGKQELGQAVAEVLRGARG